MHINFVWPGTFDADKAHHRRYREVSIDGCKLIGRGAKGAVYRYDDELVIKVNDQKNTFHDVEREIALSRKTFVMGIPTAIPFGIVSVKASSPEGPSVLTLAKTTAAQIQDLNRGTTDRYGAMYELVESETISRYIAGSPGQVDTYARIMAELAHTIHAIEASGNDFPEAVERLRTYIEGGVGRVDRALAKKSMGLVNEISVRKTLLHGDFHTGNVFLQDGEPLLIDMDRFSAGHPIAEISDLYYFYVVLGEDDPKMAERFKGFSYETSRQFFQRFLAHYLETEDEARLRAVREKASIVSYSRMIRKIYRRHGLTDGDREKIEHYRLKIAALVDRLDTILY